MKIQIVNTSDNALPAYETKNASGMDLRANIVTFSERQVILNPGERYVVPTGLEIALPEGYEAQIRPRSGLAARAGVTVLNTPGTIDADYRGEIKVILINHGKQPFVVAHGDRIAQMVIAKVDRVEGWHQVDFLPVTERGVGGIGHTGVK